MRNRYLNFLLVVLSLSGCADWQLVSHSQPDLARLAQLESFVITKSDSRHGDGKLAMSFGSWQIRDVKSGAFQTRTSGDNAWQEFKKDMEDNLWNQFTPSWTRDPRYTMSETRNKLSFTLSNGVQTVVVICRLSELRSMAVRRENGQDMGQTMLSGTGTLQCKFDQAVQGEWVLFYRNNSGHSELEAEPASTPQPEGKSSGFSIHIAGRRESKWVPDDGFRGANISIGEQEFRLHPDFEYFTSYADGRPLSVWLHGGQQHHTRPVLMYFYQDDKLVAAIDLFDTNKRLWLSSELTDAHRIALTATAAALLVSKNEFGRLLAVEPQP